MATNMDDMGGASEFVPSYGQTAVDGIERVSDDVIVFSDEPGIGHERYVTVVDSAAISTVVTGPVGRAMSDAETVAAMHAEIANGGVVTNRARPVGNIAASSEIEKS